MNESSALLFLLLLTLAVHGVVSLMNAALQSVSRAGMRERADDGDSNATRFIALTEHALA